jgi:hypothetical protein
MTTMSESARRRVVGLLVLAIATLVGRALAGTLGAPAVVSRSLYLFALASLVACVLVVATD